MEGDKDAISYLMTAVQQPEDVVDEIVKDLASEHVRDVPLSFVESMSGASDCLPPAAGSKR